MKGKYILSSLVELSNELFLAGREQLKPYAKTYSETASLLDQLFSHLLKASHFHLCGQYFWNPKISVSIYIDQSNTVWIFAWYKKQPSLCYRFRSCAVKVRNPFWAFPWAVTTLLPFWCYYKALLLNELRKQFSSRTKFIAFLINLRKFDRILLITRQSKGKIFSLPLTKMFKIDCFQILISIEGSVRY